MNNKIRERWKRILSAAKYDFDNGKISSNEFYKLILEYKENCLDNEYSSKEHLSSSEYIVIDDKKIKLQKKENTTSNAIINEKNSIENTTVSKNPVRKEPLYKESKNFYLLLFFLVIAIAFAVKYWGYSLFFLYLLLLYWFISSASGANSGGDGAGSDY